VPTLLLVNLLALLAVADLAFLSARGASRTWVLGLGGLLWAGVTVAMAVHLVVSGEATPFSALMALILVLAAGRVAIRASGVVRHLREHRHDLESPPLRIPGSVEIHRLVAEAGEEGFVLVPEGVVQGAGGHGESAVMVDAEGRSMEICGEGPPFSIAMASLTADGRFVFTQDSPEGPPEPERHVARSSVVDGAIADLVAEHRRIEAWAVAQGHRIVPVAAEEALDASRRYDLEAWHPLFTHPWRYAVRALLRFDRES
jgi:hypothetical protein